MHDMSLEQFAVKYPDNPLLSEETKNQKQAAANKRAANGYSSISKYMKERRGKELFETIRIYCANPKFCVNCKNPLSFKERDNKFCSAKNCLYVRHSRDHTEESRKKLSDTMKEKIRVDPIFKQKALSNLISPKEALKLREAWKYQEIKNILDIKEIRHEFEFGMGNFIYDLALFDTKILIEFDGLGHGYQCVKEYEDEKDQWAIENGWKIFRIKVRSNMAIDPIVLSVLNLIK